MLARLSSYFIIIIFIVIAIGLFLIKDSVSNLSYQLSEVNRQILQEKNNIHMLKAETAYLTSPGKLRNLTNTYLTLSNIKPDQMIKNPLTTIENQDFADIDASAITLKSHVKWRYKRSPNKYLKTVSERR
jgi:hypothetical protein